MSSEININEFMEKYAKPYDPTEEYFREAFTNDTKVGKNSAIYNAHSYHTKVPPQGIIPYIEHYTKPGDLILDPFCGSGMTGVAAIMCNRPSILNDLSPAACHIAYNYCTPFDFDAIKNAFNEIKNSILDEFDWLYGTKCPDCNSKATIHYTIWSDVFKCLRCGTDIILWDVVRDPSTGSISEKFYCPKCSKEWRKTRLKLIKTIPVVINYQCHGKCNPKRKEHLITESEIEKLEQIKNKEIPYWYPIIRFDNSREMWRGGHRELGIFSISDFYTKRNLWAMSSLWSKINQMPDTLIKSKLKFILTSQIIRASKLRRVRKSGPGDNLSGTLYVSSLTSESNILISLERKINELKKIKTEYKNAEKGSFVIVNGTATKLNISDNTIDYIFTDPPFGSNIFYADCSLLWEAWLQEFTDERYEAVWNKSKKPEQGGKTLADYECLMTESFKEMHRVLKPGRWASVVFHNSDDRVFRAIQRAADVAGFDLVNAMMFDKTQRSFKQIKGYKGEENVSQFDVVMNLHKKAKHIINGFKFNDNIEHILLHALENHLKSLPKLIQEQPKTYSDAHRTTQFLHSLAIRTLLNQNIAIEKVTIPFIESLATDHFKKVGNKWYLRSERITTDRLALDDIHDEASAIVWLENIIQIEPKVIGEIIPQWQIATLNISDKIQKDLIQILEENFWQDDRTGRWRIPTPEERQKMGDIRLIQNRKNIKKFLSGSLPEPPGSKLIAEWIEFCYQHKAYKEGAELFKYIDTDALDQEYMKKIKKVAKACSLNAQKLSSTENQIQLL